MDHTEQPLHPWPGLGGTTVLGMFVFTFEVVALHEPNDAVVNDVENARFVEHFQHVFVFRAGLEPQQRHAVSAVANHELHDRLLCSFWCEEEHDHLGREAFFDGRANGATENSTACIAWVNRHQSPTLPVEIVNGAVGRFFGVQAGPENVDGSGLADRSDDGGVGVSKHGYLLSVFFFNQCSSPQNSSIKTTQSVMNT